MKLITVVAAALVDAEGRVLVTQRPPGKDMAGLWEFPGGKIESGESPEAALIREIQEELGVTLSINHVQPLTFASHRYDHFHLLMPLYIATQWQGEIHGHDGQPWQWVDATGLERLPMPPADVPLVQALQKWISR